MFLACFLGFAVACCEKGNMLCDATRSVTTNNDNEQTVFAINVALPQESREQIHQSAFTNELQENVFQHNDVEHL